MFTDSDIAKVMNHANITAGHLPSDSDARDIVRAAIATGVLLGVVGFYLTDEGDFITVIERDSFAAVMAGPISTRYLWRSGLTGAAAVRDMLTCVHNEATAARTGTHPNAESRP